MAERSRNSSSSSRKLKFAPKAPVSKRKQPTARSSSRQETEEEYVVDKEIVTRLRTRQAATAIEAGTDDDSVDQKPQSSSQTDLQSEADKQNIYGAYIALPMRPDNTNSDELDKIEFGQPSRTSSEMEASINAAKDLGLEKESNDQRMLLFNFPPLPYEIPALNTEDIDNKGKKKTKKIACNLQQVPPGYVGKMLIYKSGKVKMKVGDVIFDVNPGVKYFFHEKAVATNAKKKHFCELGNIQQHAVVTPDIDDLLDGSKK